jgi:hypothetical protein
VRNLEKRLKTQNQNGPIYLPGRDFPKKMHDLRDIWVSFRRKFQVAEINSDTQTVHSFYKYMRKIRAKRIQELERRNFFFFFFFFFFVGRNQQLVGHVLALHVVVLSNCYHYGEEDFNPFSFVYYFFCKLFISFQME